MATVAANTNSAAGDGSGTGYRDADRANTDAVRGRLDFGGRGRYGGGDGRITIAGVSGAVTHAYLYWHGIDSGGDGIYDNATVTINGNSVTGTAIGDATTNCWGAGSSRAFEADVTAYVSGNGSYAIAGLSNATGHNANGASLVVVFDDATAADDRDLVFFTGNDSSEPEGFPGETDGWHASLPLIAYGGGTARAELHVADGQNAGDDSLTFSTVNGSTVIGDTAALYDGNSLPSAGTSRASNGELWDIHDLDITGAFGGLPATVSLDIDGMDFGGDCLGLVLLLLDLEPGSAPPAPCGDGNSDPGEQCDDGNSDNGDCCSSTCQYEANGTPCADNTVCNGAEVCHGAGTCQAGTALNCSDLDPCTQDSCDPVDGCESVGGPRGGCLTAQKSLLLLKQKGGSKDKLVWKWIKGAQLEQSNLADPTLGTGYALCVYAGTANGLIAGASLPPGTGWSPVGSSGYKFKGTSPNGLTKAILKGGAAGKSKALAKGKGASLPDPTLPLAYQSRCNSRKTIRRCAWRAPSPAPMRRRTARRPSRPRNKIAPSHQRPLRHPSQGPLFLISSIGLPPTASSTYQIWPASRAPE